MALSSDLAGADLQLVSVQIPRGARMIQSILDDVKRVRIRKSGNLKPVPWEDSFKELGVECDRMLLAAYRSPFDATPTRLVPAAVGDESQQ